MFIASVCLSVCLSVCQNLVVWKQNLTMMQGGPEKLSSARRSTSSILIPSVWNQNFVWDKCHQNLVVYLLLWSSCWMFSRKIGDGYSGSRCNKNMADDLGTWQLIRNSFKYKTPNRLSPWNDQNPNLAGLGAKMLKFRNILETVKL